MYTVSTARAKLPLSLWIPLTPLAPPPSPPLLQINKENTKVNYANVLFELNFALLALSIISGAIGHRVKSVWLFGIVLASLLLNYTPQAHWFWNEKGWGFRNMDADKAGTFAGVLDYAGGLSVHQYAGIAALVIGIFAGDDSTKREDASDNDQTTLLSEFGFLCWGGVGWG